MHQGFFLDVLARECCDRAEWNNSYYSYYSTGTSQKKRNPTLRAHGAWTAAPGRQGHRIVERIEAVGESAVWCAAGPPPVLHVVKPSLTRNQLAPCPSTAPVHSVRLPPSYAPGCILLERRALRALRFIAVPCCGGSKASSKAERREVLWAGVWWLACATSSCCITQICIKRGPARQDIGPAAPSIQPRPGDHVRCVAGGPTLPVRLVAAHASDVFASCTGLYAS